ncbi:hypothetical protein ACFE04_016444 [Oxalis oulophora]
MWVLKIFLLVSIYVTVTHAHDYYTESNINNNSSSLAGIEFPDDTNNLSFNSGCSFSNKKQPLKNHDNLVKLHMKHRSTIHKTDQKHSVLESTIRDLTRIQRVSRLRSSNNHRRSLQEKEQDTLSGQQLVATLGSGVSLGSGEYFMDVFIGTPPKHFSLILDTGSDLNWIQCVPCHDCFKQTGPYYDPNLSNSFRNITCNDPRCNLVTSPDPPRPCKAENQSCPYYYWYGDSSNTTGDFALETFTVNLTMNNGKSESRHLENMMFGCGHWNRGLFQGAAGLLGLGRGALSFSSQLQSLYGHSFSYCLVDRYSDSNVTSKLIFGEVKELLSHPDLNFTSLVAGKENPVDTYYFVKIKSILIDGEALEIPEETWQISSEGVGGTIVDSGTTLSYFVEPAYNVIKDSFMKKVKDYPLTQEFPMLDTCYNVTGVEKVEFPRFGILFADGAVWNFPVENYMITIVPDELVCLAILGTPKNGLSIIGNIQQQNFYVVYDTKKSRIGYAPRNCADI